MKRIILPLFFSFFIASGYSQVGIGTTNPDPSSVLDVQSTNKGLLIPRVELEATTRKNPVADPVEGLLVYNTKTTADVTPGFYYWAVDGPVIGGGIGNGLWKALTTTGTVGGNNWSLLGNEVGDTDVLGTTNAKALKFIIDGRDFGKFDPNGGLALGNGSSASGLNSTALGKGSSASANNSTALGFGATATDSNTIILGNDSARVGIGTSPNATAVLDINSSKKGLLIPRVNLTSTTNKGPITGTPAESLLVYNNNIANDVTKGFYYWTGLAWKSLEVAPGGGSVGGWTLNGNSVNPTNFLGTTNWQPLVLKANSAVMGQFQTNGGVAFSIGSSSAQDAVAIGRSANASGNQSLALGYEATAKQDAVAVGRNAKNNDNESVAIGKGAESAYRALAIGLTAKNNGNESVAIGYGAQSNYQNIAIGLNAKANANDAIVLGSGAIASNQNTVVIGKGATANANDAIVLGSGAIGSSQNNVVIGKDGYASGNEAIAIGNSAIANGANSMALGNGAATSAANQIVLGNSSVTTVKTSGKMTIGAYTLPNTDGTANYVLKTDGRGVVTWQPDNDTAPRPENMATTEDIERLQELIADQQHQINELKAAVQQLLSADGD